MIIAALLSAERGKWREKEEQRVAAGFLLINRIVFE